MKYSTLFLLTNFLFWARTLAGIQDTVALKANESFAIVGSISSTCLLCQRTTMIGDSSDHLYCLYRIMVKDILLDNNSNTFNLNNELLKIKYIVVKKEDVDSMGNETTLILNAFYSKLYLIASRILPNGSSVRRTNNSILVNHLTTAWTFRWWFMPIDGLLRILPTQLYDRLHMKIWKLARTQQIDCFAQWITKNDS